MQIALVRVFIFSLFIISCRSYEPGVKRVQNPQGLIVDGEASYPGQWPWFVSLHIVGYQGSEKPKFICGATLVSTKDLITAAHCIKPTLSYKMIAMLGQFNISDPNEANGIRRTIAERHMHEDYGKTRRKSEADIAILVMDAGIKFTDYIIPIQLPEKDENVFNVYGTVAGYGKPEVSSESTEVPFHINLKSIGLLECIWSYNTSIFVMSERSFCAGSSQGVPCQGDSGSGFVRIINQRWTLLGVVSFAFDDQCSPTDHISFVNVPKFNHWILEKVEQNLCKIECHLDSAPKAEALIKITRNDYGAVFDHNQEIVEKVFSNCKVKDRKIVVLSVVGAYRQGKSFFLDYCLRYLYATYGSLCQNKKRNGNWIGDPNEPLSGFSWKHGVTADTKGLMMWSDVFLYDAPNGEKIAIVVIDTQGLFTLGSSEEENAKIITFSTLISSIQIFNIKERIHENQIAHLQSVTEIANLINNKNGLNSRKAFNELLLLLRDFEDVDYDYNFGYEDGQEYLNKYLQYQEEGINNERRLNQTFDKISCFLLNHPGSSIKSRSFKGEWGKLNSDFVKNLKILIESLLAPEKLVKKSILGNEMTAENFKDFFLQLSEAFELPGIPSAEKIYQIIKKF